MNLRQLEFLENYNYGKSKFYYILLLIIFIFVISNITPVLASEDTLVNTASKSKGRFWSWRP